MFRFKTICYFSIILIAFIGCDDEEGPDYTKFGMEEVLNIDDKACKVKWEGTDDCDTIRVRNVSNMGIGGWQRLDTCNFLNSEQKGVIREACRNSSSSGGDHEGTEDFTYDFEFKSGPEVHYGYDDYSVGNPDHWGDEAVYASVKEGDYIQITLSMEGNLSSEDDGYHSISVEIDDDNAYCFGTTEDGGNTKTYSIGEDGINENRPVGMSVYCKMGGWGETEIEIYGLSDNAAKEKMEAKAPLYILGYMEKEVNDSIYMFPYNISDAESYKEYVDGTILRQAIVSTGEWEDPHERGDFNGSFNDNFWIEYDVNENQCIDIDFTYDEDNLKYVVDPNSELGRLKDKILKSSNDGIGWGDTGEIYTPPLFIVINQDIDYRLLRTKKLVEDVESGADTIIVENDVFLEENETYKIGDLSDPFNPHAKREDITVWELEESAENWIVTLEKGLENSYSTEGDAVWDLSIPNGIAFPENNLAFISNQEAIGEKRTIAHELLHMEYMGKLHHVLIEEHRENDRNNLMYPFGSGEKLRMCVLEMVYNYNYSQWKRIRAAFEEM